MFRKLSIGSVQRITKAVAVVFAATFMGGTVVHADPKPQTWKITLKGAKGAKVDVYDVVAGRYVSKDKDISGGATFDAKAVKGGGWEADKVGTHIRWHAKLNGRCWWGQVCSTKPQVEATVVLRPDDSVGAGNCRIEGKSPACGSSY
jgi:hypothetical protein